MSVEKILAGRYGVPISATERAAFQRAATGQNLPTTQGPDGSYLSGSTARAYGLWLQAVEWVIIHYGLVPPGLHAELASLRAEVKEWLCSDCNTVYPGPPQEGFACVVCTKCGGSTGPRLAMENRLLRTFSAGGQYIPTNFTTHRSAWRDAITECINAETVKGNGDRAAYWQHELAAYDRSFGRLLDHPEPIRTSAQAVPSEAEVSAAEAKLYRDLTGDAMALGYDGVPAALEALRKGARAALPVPLEAIGNVVAEAMKAASDNGANSISMPDEYVAVAHFVAYPGEYALAGASAAASTRTVEIVTTPAAHEQHIAWLHTILRENAHCIDGGTCHHGCGEKGTCFREANCVPLSGSKLDDNWTLPTPDQIS
jgi:hypothetical protein